MIGVCVQPAFEQTASCVGVPPAKVAPGEAGLLFPENAGFSKSIFLKSWLEMTGTECVLGPRGAGGRSHSRGQAGQPRCVSLTCHLGLP